MAEEPEWISKAKNLKREAIGVAPPSPKEKSTEAEEPEWVKRAKTRSTAIADKLAQSPTVERTNELPEWIAKANERTNRPAKLRVGNLAPPPLPPEPEWSDRTRLLRKVSPTVAEDQQLKPPSPMPTNLERPNRERAPSWITRQASPAVVPVSTAKVMVPKSQRDSLVAEVEEARRQFEKLTGERAAHEQRLKDATNVLQKTQVQLSNSKKCTSLLSTLESEKEGSKLMEDYITVLASAKKVSSGKAKLEQQMKSCESLEAWNKSANESRDAKKHKRHKDKKEKKKEKA